MIALHERFGCGCRQHSHCASSLVLRATAGPVRAGFLFARACLGRGVGMTTTTSSWSPIAQGCEHVEKLLPARARVFFSGFVFGKEELLICVRSGMSIGLAGAPIQRPASRGTLRWALPSLAERFPRSYVRRSSCLASKKLRV